jgi:hypothetical protein
MIGPQHGPFAQRENLADRENQASQFDFDWEGQAFETG